jgi:acetyl-CoA synthetase
MGRVDDVLNVRPSAEHDGDRERPGLARQGGRGGGRRHPDDLKGQADRCFVTLKLGDGSEELKDELKNHVRKEIGVVATPDAIRFTNTLPKTRSGKIMRRLLRDIAAGREQVGDTTTLEDFAILAKLRKEEE